MFPARYCKGITFESGASYPPYSVRIGDEIKTSANTNEISYTRSDCKEEVTHTKAQSFRLMLFDLFLSSVAVLCVHNRKRSPEILKRFA